MTGYFLITCGSENWLVITIPLLTDAQQRDLEPVPVQMMSKQQDKTCVPPVEATEEQRETLHMKAIGKQENKKRVLDLIQGASNFSIVSDMVEEDIKTKIQYEVTLRHGDEDSACYYVDVREDIVTLDDDPVTEEYIEGFGFDTYDGAKKKYLEFIAQYDTLDTELCTWNEIEDK